VRFKLAMFEIYLCIIFDLRLQFWSGITHKCNGSSWEFEPYAHITIRLQ